MVLALREMGNVLVLTTLLGRFVCQPATGSSTEWFRPHPFTLHMDDSARVKSLREHDELKVDAAYAHYSTALDLVLSSLHAEEQARRLQRKLEAGGEQRRTIGCRAEAASRARAIENYVEPGQTAAPWEWLPPFDPGLPASAMERALTAQLQRSAHFHASSCDTMLGEAGACPAIVATQRKEQERALRVGAWEVRTAAAAECGTSAVYAAALAQRDAALAAMAQEARAEQLSEREGLAAFREKEVRCP